MRTNGGGTGSSHDRGRRSLPWAALALALSPAPAVAGAADSSLREVAAEWGVDFRHHHGGSGRRYMVETMSGGVVVADFDDDGDQDLFFVDGDRLPGYDGEPGRSRLLRNDGGRGFTDVTPRAGIEAGLYANGATAGDCDNDGDLDLYVTAWGPNRLLENRGDGSFRDVTDRAGVGDPLWGTSAAFADVDRDGDLDLYVVNYVDFTIAGHVDCRDTGLDLPVYCQPSTYPGQPDRFYRNAGDCTFTDATAAAGFDVAEDMAGLGLGFGDLDEDGWPDLYVANDTEPNFLFLSNGDGTVEESGLLSGTAVGDRGNPEAGMGVELGDVDGDGRVDIFVTNFENETNALYSNHGDGFFVDRRYPLRLAEPSLVFLAFGVVLADIDHDADLDALVANGHVKDNAAEFYEYSSYGQRNQLFENVGGRFEEVADSGLDLARVSRGLAAGDLDGDGDIDFAVVNSNEMAEVYENLSAPGAFLLVDLAGGGSDQVRASNRYGVGARLVVESGGARQVREVRTGISYQSQSALTAHFGLGGAGTVDRLAVRWPSGRRQAFVGLPAGVRVRLHE